MLRLIAIAIALLGIALPAAGQTIDAKDVLAGLGFPADTEQQVLAGTPGEDLNLSAAEIEAFQALSGQPVSQVEQQVRKSLLARYAARGSVSRE